MKLPLAIVPVLLCLTVFATPLVQESICKGETKVLSETWIGKGKNVKMATLACSELNKEARGALAKRQTNVTNVCGANCNTNCFLPAGGGPDPNDCHVIADALRYESQNTGAIFQINTTVGNPIVMKYSSCETFFVNQDLGPLAYCRTDWAALIDWVAPNCQATQNAHGGNCVAVDQRWFVQVQHV